ncbi:MAG: hypothetical protein GY810_20310 [Aureispira sp.]|nr:hypothetical protein [Aureispira sp.]
MNTYAWILALLVLGCFVFYLTACQPSSSRGGGGTVSGAAKAGYLHYYKDLDTKSRIRAVDGTGVVLQYGLEHNPSPEGAHDGDSGVQWFVRFLDKADLEKGKTYTLPTKSFEVYVVFWASPAGYKVITDDKLSGSFTLVDYDEYQKLTIDYDLTVDRDGTPKKFANKGIAFDCNNFYKKVAVSNLDIEAWDSSSTVAQEEIKIQDLEGRRNAVARTYQNAKGVFESFYNHFENHFFQLDEKGFVKSTLISKPAVVKIIGNTLHYTNRDTQKEEVIYINKITETELVLSWQRGELKEQYTYTK